MICARTFTIDIPPLAPALLLPENARTATTSTPTFSWQAMTNAKDYQVQVDENSDFSSLEFNNTAATASRTPATALADGAYFRRVRVTNI